MLPVLCKDSANREQYTILLIIKFSEPARFVLPSRSLSYAKKTIPAVRTVACAAEPKFMPHYFTMSCVLLNFAPSMPPRG